MEKQTQVAMGIKLVTYLGGGIA